jgi:hypothetical protein
MWSLHRANTITGRACASTLMPVDPAPATVSHPAKVVIDADANKPAATVARQRVGLRE